MINIELAEKLFKSGNNREVIKLLSNCEDDDAIFIIARAYLLDKNVVKAIENFKLAIYKRPKFIEPYINLINIYIEEKNFTEAQIYSQKAYLLNPNDIRVINLIGLLQFNLGNYTQAKDAFLASYELDKNNSFTKACLSDSYFFLGEFENALRFNYLNTGKFVFDLTKNEAKVFYELS